MYEKYIYCILIGAAQSPNNAICKKRKKKKKESQKVACNFDTVYNYVIELRFKNILESLNLKNWLKIFFQEKLKNPFNSHGT